MVKTIKSSVSRFHKRCLNVKLHFSKSFGSQVTAEYLFYYKNMFIILYFNKTIIFIRLLNLLIYY